MNKKTLTGRSSQGGEGSGLLIADADVIFGRPLKELKSRRLNQFCSVSSGRKNVARIVQLGIKHMVPPGGATSKTIDI